MADPRYVGHGSTSPESSSDTQYLYRAPPVSDVISNLASYGAIGSMRGERAIGSMRGEREKIERESSV